MTDIFMTGSDASNINSFFLSDGSTHPPTLPGPSDRVLFVQMKSGSLNVDEIASFTGFPNNTQIVGTPTIRGGSVTASTAPLGVHVEGESGGPAASANITDTITNGATAENGVLHAKTILDSVTARAFGQINVTTNITAVFGTVTATNGGHVDVTGAIKAAAVTALDGGSIHAASIESIGTVGMTNQVDGGSLTTGKYNIVSRAGMTDVLDILDGGVVNVTGGAFSFGFGRLVGDQGSVTIDGVGSKLNVSGALVVGNAGHCTLIVRNHATENLSGLVLGQQATGVGFVQVLTGAKLGIASSVTLGGIDSTLTIGPDASVEIGGNGGAHANELRIDASGLLVGHGTINAGALVNRGTIEARGGILVLNDRFADRRGDQDRRRRVSSGERGQDRRGDQRHRIAHQGRRG
jgi:T5SS/PEP-CTERM-associated repeat protein